MEVKSEKKVIETDGAHIYDLIEDQWYRCRDCRVKVSWQEIDRHHHRHKCNGER